MKDNIKKIIILLTIIVIFFTIFLYDYKNKQVILSQFKAPTPFVKDITIDESNNMIIKIGTSNDNYKSNMYYLYKNDNEDPLKYDPNWKLIENNEFSFKMGKNKYYAFLKNEDDEIFNIDNLNDYSKIVAVSTSKKKIFIAINGTYNLNADYDYIGDKETIDDSIIWYSENDKIATVDAKGKVKGIKKGNTKVYAKIGDIQKEVDVIVTNLITVRPKKYNNNKKYLPCGKYTKEENDMLDEILKDRINDVGYKTRAATVEAARFLALEFPYKIRYFSENGRGSTNGVDGEGRYYHVGLYLDESRYKGKKKKSSGPKTWGCSLYSRPSHGKRPNGLDCSGFVSWVMLQGGFDVGDIGAGLAPHKDLTDYGKRTKFNADVVKSGKVKVGDLLSSGGVNGGHIAIIVGEDSNYYYVAESLWTPPNVAVVIIPYSKKNLFKRYYYVMLMDDYYKKDGNLTKMWY